MEGCDTRRDDSVPVKGPIGSQEVPTTDVRNVTREATAPGEGHIGSQQQPAKECTVSSQANGSPEQPDTANRNAEPGDSREEGPPSKRARKRALKAEKWAATRDERLEKRRERRVLEKQGRKEKVRQGLAQKRIRKVADQTPVDISIVVDCDFDELMNDKELKSTASQLGHCYSANRTSTQTVKLYFTSFKGKVQEQLQQKCRDYERWSTTLNPNSRLIYEEKRFDQAGIVDKENLVYLTADSPDTLTTLEEGKAYIIGGIVDKNRHKYLCYDRARELGIATAKLPIGDFIAMQTRQVLTINHGRLAGSIKLVEIMIKWIQTKDWQQSFMHVIPQRKGIAARLANEENDSKDGAESGDGSNDDDFPAEGEIDGFGGREPVSAGDDDSPPQKISIGSGAVSVDSPSQMFAESTTDPS
ncbi:guanine-1-methyltransferase-domain-containing protein [Phlyctochytrium arcticum]|nr:guanine-1-methyltransferase-domain-containing protein [Phlyctochytrium arcticum]